MENDDRDVIHVSPWLVKAISTAIITGLGSIAIYMVFWAVADARYKTDLLGRVQNIEIAVKDIRMDIAVLPYTTHKIETLERDLEKLERKQEAHGK